MPQTSLFNYFSKPAETSEVSVKSVHKSRDIKSSDIEFIVEKPEDAINTEPQSAAEKQELVVEARAVEEPEIIPIIGQPQAYITPVDASHLPALKRLTGSTLPVRYPDNFFTATVDEIGSASLARVCIYNEQPVGWIRCRLETVPTTSPPAEPAIGQPAQIYIQALCLLAPYRGYGFAGALLDSLLGSKYLKNFELVCIYAHVWEANENALEWYEKKSFKRVMLLGQYYRRLKPSSAWIVRRDMGCNSRG